MIVENLNQHIQEMKERRRKIIEHSIALLIMGLIGIGAVVLHSILK